MDMTMIVLKALELIPRFVPQPKPPTFDYNQLRSSYPTVPATATVVVEREPPPNTQPVSVAPIAIQAKPGKEVATSCMACSRSHLSTVSGALNEALRFARDEGIASPEVQKRLMMAEDEINMLERIDMSSDAIQASPEQDQELAHQFLPRIRSLRQEIGQVASVDTLERTAAEANVLGQEFRLSIFQAKGGDLNPIVDLAQRVQRGEISLDAAKEELKRILPED